MSRKRRKLKIFPVICVVLVLALAVWAIVLISGTFSKPNNKTEDKTVDVSMDNDKEKAPSDDSQETDGGSSDSGDDGKTEVPTDNEKEPPEEDNTVYTPDAPKPVYTQAQLLEMYPDSVLDKSEDAGQSYIDDIVFIGDSTTHGMAFYGVLKGGKETTQVWTPKSGTLAMWNLLTENIVYPEDDSEMLIGDAIGIKRPKMVVLTLGVNGVSSLSEEDFKKYYQGLIDVIKKESYETQIILQSIYPVCDYYQYVNSISMEKINRANGWIAQLADANDIYYLNTISALVGENGYLTETYCNGDGIHISKEGFNVVLEYIRTHAID